MATDNDPARDTEESVHATGTGGKSPEETITSSPQGDVEYDPAALKEAAERMHAEGTGSKGSKSPEETITSSPQGDVEYDPAALKEAAERMHAEGSDT
jgi:hypothetical protein